MGNFGKGKMDSANGQPAADSRGAGKIPIEEMPKTEKINFYFRDILRVYPEQIPLVIKSFQDWARQWE
jgi:hypothetical protein